MAVEEDPPTQAAVVAAARASQLAVQLAEETADLVWVLRFTLAHIQEVVAAALVVMLETAQGLQDAPLAALAVKVDKVERLLVIHHHHSVVWQLVPRMKVALAAVLVCMAKVPTALTGLTDHQARDRPAQRVLVGLVNLMAVVAAEVAVDVHRLVFPADRLLLEVLAQSVLSGLADHEVHLPSLQLMWGHK